MPVILLSYRFCFNCIQLPSSLDVTVILPYCEITYFTLLHLCQLVIPLWFLSLQCRGYFRDLPILMERGPLIVLCLPLASIYLYFDLGIKT